MFESFGAFFEALWQARFGFAELWAWLCEIYQSAINMTGVIEIRQSIDAFFVPVQPYIPYILILLLSLVSFFGKKLMPIIKFLGFFFLGFIFGAHYITPLLAGVIAIPAWVYGLAIGIIASVLYRFVYYTLYTLGIVYSVYIICYTGFTFQPQTIHSSSKAVTCLVVAVVIAVLALIFRKYVEMVGTALLGGFLVFIVVNFMLFDFYSLELLWYTPWIAPLAFTLVLGIPGSIVQLKMRKRY